MSEEDNKDELISKVSRKLKSSTDDISPQLAARLQAARKMAIEKGLSKEPVFTKYWKPATMALSSAAALVVVLLTTNIQTAQDLNIMEDLTLLSAHQEIEFYENIEFYSWLEEAQENG